MTPQQVALAFYAVGSLCFLAGTLITYLGTLR